MSAAIASRYGARWVWVVGAAVAAALAVSGALYVRSRAADFHLHAQVVEAFGRAARADQLVSKQVVAARFGLLNQYDPLNATELELAQVKDTLRARVDGAVGTDAALEGAFARLDDAMAAERQAIERFKADNSILRNSVYYLPLAARELLEHLPPPAAADRGAAIGRLTEAALFYNLVGDESARGAYLRALSELEGGPDAWYAPARPYADLLLAHARVIRDKQSAVDGWVKRSVDGSVGERISELQRLYDDRFGAAVAASNAYRKVLYGWSILLALVVAAAGLELRRLYGGLERRVAERTADLARALEALWGEMRLARKIQEALVPAAPALGGCDVAVSMRAAEDVGGDYYDVVSTGGREWILIGDVSGHGVPAGLVMMMCHTAVRTVLHGDPDVMPHELLARVNAVLTENIRQLGEDKYMTITAFRRDAQGTLLFAGAHQDIFVYRTATDTVESFETEGLWLGLKEDIADSLRTSSIRLASGDVLVVYTDGITEAACNGTTFDTAGLRRVLAGARGRTARQILDETFHALEAFEVADDATLMVIRQL